MKNFDDFSTRKKYVIVFSVLFLFLFIVVMFVMFISNYSMFKSKYNTFYENHEWEELLEIPKDYTPEQVMEAGMADVDVTHTLKEESEEITDFLSHTESNKFDTLKVLSSDEEGDCIKFYIYDESYDEIVMETYYYNKQASASGYYYDGYYQMTENGITTVYLDGIEDKASPFGSITTEDEILYQYEN